jgi:hypothetical protein
MLRIELGDVSASRVRAKTHETFQTSGRDNQTKNNDLVTPDLT